MSPDEICRHFAIPDYCRIINPLGKGLINDTYLVEPLPSTGSDRYVLQRINKIVFREPEKVMHNLVRINKHLEHKRSAYQELILTVGGSNSYEDSRGDYWRITRYVENTVTLYKAHRPEIAYEAARTYGTFLGDLRDLPVSEIYETIPKFHNYANRILQLKDSIQKNAHKRLNVCQEEVQKALTLSRYIEEFYVLNLPVSVIHSDTKLTNILFDADTLKGKMVIDLDIAMPGSILFDYGDMIRSFTNTLEEDDPQLEMISVQKDIFEQISKGFLESARTFLIEKEAENLLLGAKVVILVQAIRNLTDFLNGDIYYKTDYDLHNLHRTQNQLTLLEAIENDELSLRSLINKYL